MRSMLSTLWLLMSCLATLAPAQVQVTAKLISKVQLKVVATDNSNRPTTKTVPANTNLNNGVTLDVAVLGARATYLARIDGSPARGWLARLRDTAAGTHPTGYTGGSAITGPNKVQLVLTTNKTVPARVVISLQATTGYTASVDIGADGKVEFTGSSGASQKELLATVSSNGLSIEITSSATTGGRNAATFWGELHVAVQPRCAVKQIGAGCGSKPTLTVSPAFDDSIDLQLSGALPLTTVVLGLGSGQTNVLLPSLPALGPPCPMHTNVLAMQLLTTDIFGTTALKVQAPKGVKISGNVQMYTIATFGSAVDIRSTPAFNIDCK